MTLPMMGIETEYGFTALGTNGLSLEDAVLHFFNEVRARWPHLPDGGSGIFLTNGARFYLDQRKPEFCTPECTDPWEVVRYVRAGHHVLETAAAALVGRAEGIAEIVLQRCNVDYGGSQATWGCHESYLHRTTPALLPPQLLPHLVSRVVYTGAGGFNSRAPYTLQFTLSPRAWHLDREVSGQSTQGRGIFHTKDEPLAKPGYHRLHLLCGESNCSETSLWLKVGTTALVVALIDGGVQPGDAVQLQSPLAAMRQFADDPTCRRTVQTAIGNTLSAIDIQRHYLDLAEAHLGASFMPQWAADVCRCWRSILEQLGGAPGAVATTLDWAIKHALYVNHARRRGVALEVVPLWNAVVTEIATAWERRNPGHVLVSDAALGPNSPVADEVNRLTPMLRDHGLRWEDFQAFLAMRHELFEIDARFGQLDGQSIFGALDRAGVLRHHIDGVERIDRAVQDPPTVGRAAVRGRLVRELHSAPNRYVCDWSRVWDRAENRGVDLSDPYTAKAEWHPVPSPHIGGGDSGPSSYEQELRNLQAAEESHGVESVDVALACNQIGVCLRSLGRPDEAEPFQRRALALDERLRGSAHPKIPHRLNNLAVVLVMQGKRDEAKSLLARAWQLKRGCPDITSARIAWVRLATALLDHADPRVFLGQLKSLLALRELPGTGDVAMVWDYEPIVAHLRASLEPSHNELLTRSAATLNNWGSVAGLEALPAWEAHSPVSLDVPWPD